MQDNADTIVQGWLSRKPQIAANQSPADAIVNRWLIKQPGNINPLDDSALSVQQAQNAIGDQSYNGLCEKFAEQESYGKTGLYATAIDAWNNYQQSGKAQTEDPIQAPAGALIYWNADESNYGDGHVSIADGQGNMIAATSQGVKQMPIAEWSQQTGQQPLGFVIPN